MKKLIVLFVSVMFILTGCKNDLIGEKSNIKIDDNEVEFTLHTIALPSLAQSNSWLSSVSEK